MFIYDGQVEILQSFLLRCSTRPHEWDTQWDLNSHVKICLSSLLIIAQDAFIAVKLFETIIGREWSTGFYQKKII